MGAFSKVNNTSLSPSVWLALPSSLSGFHFLTFYFPCFHTSNTTHDICARSPHPRPSSSMLVFPLRRRRWAMLRREQRQEEVCVVSGVLVPDQAGGHSFHRVMVPAGVGQSQGSEIKPQLGALFHACVGSVPETKRLMRVFSGRWIRSSVGAGSHCSSGRGRG